MPALIAEGSLPLTEENRTKPIEIPGMGFPVHPADLPGELNDPEAFKWGSYEFFLRLARRAREAPIVFVNTFRELEENVLAALDELHSRAAAGGQVRCAIKINIFLKQLKLRRPFCLLLHSSIHG